MLAAPAVSILKYDTCAISRAMRASSAAGSGVPATGASWIMMGMSMASDTCWKNPTTCSSATRMVAPWYGGMIITMAAPCSCARRLRAAHTRVP